MDERERIQLVEDAERQFTADFLAALTNQRRRNLLGMDKIEKKDESNSMVQAVRKLAECESLVQMTAGELSHARNNHTDAMNQLNAAQAEFDKLVTSVKAGAPNGSDWKKDIERAGARERTFDGSAAQ